MRWPKNPRVLEINIWTWLKELTQRYGRAITLENIPREELDAEIGQFDAVWLMGVWERSPRARQIALRHPGLLEQYRRALPDFRPEDVVGSPYSIRRYRVDPRLGGRKGLAGTRASLADRGVLLLLDFVPNHIAIDHDWTLDRPSHLIRGTQEDLATHPDRYFRARGSIYAHGRDPYFPPWSDTAQINVFHEDARRALGHTLHEVASQCDGVRCDMAMLVTNEVFARTWKERAGSPPRREFWEELIPAVKKRYPDFLLVAEVYWGMEWRLQQQGFDFCYDKRLYDRMAHEDAESVRAHLGADLDYQTKLIRFIENHDEARAPVVFQDRAHAAAILAFTLPGAKLVHEGQTHGHRIKVPIQLGRGPFEADDASTVDFYRGLIKAAAHQDHWKGTWRLGRIQTETPMRIFKNLIVHLWDAQQSRTLTLVNFGSTPIQGNIRLEGIPYPGRWRFSDLLTGKTRVYDENQLENRGIAVDLPPWYGHIFHTHRLT